MESTFISIYIKIVGLLIYSNLQTGHILISSTVFEIQGFNITKKKRKLPLFCGNIAPMVLA